MDKGSMRPAQLSKCLGTKHLLIPPGAWHMCLSVLAGPAPPTYLLAEATIDQLAVELLLFGMAAF